MRDVGATGFSAEIVAVLATGLTLDCGKALSLQPVPDDLFASSVLIPQLSEPPYNQEVSDKRQNHRQLYAEINAFKTQGLQDKYAR